MTYGIVVWGTTRVSIMNRLQVLQNKILRQLLNLYPDPITFRQVTTQRVHEMSGMKPLRDFAKRLTLKCYHKMLVHRNELMRNLTNARNARIDKRNFLNFIGEYL